MNSADPAPILDGVRVLDFGRYIAGPYCAALLADLGADVIRVEKVGGSEDRFIGPVAPSGEGGMFLQCNRGKRGMTLEPTRPEGRTIVERLLSTADVVIANLPRRGLASMGLDPAELRARHPRLVVAAIDAFGAKGPWADRVGFDALGQAMSGAMHLTGPAGTPTKAGVNTVDFTTAIATCAGVLAALYARTRTGEGRLVEASLLGSALTVANAYLVEEAVRGVGRTSLHNQSHFAGPSDTFRTTDGWVVVQVVGQTIFERWARAVGADETIHDPRFATDTDRGDHGAILSERMAGWCAERTTEDVLDAMHRAGVPAGPVLAPRDVLSHPQVIGSAYLQPLPFPSLPAPAPVAVAPFALSGEPRPLLPAPTLGQHTAEILHELGYGADEVAAFRQSGVV